MKERKSTSKKKSTYKQKKANIKANKTDKKYTKRTHKSKPVTKQNKKTNKTTNKQTQNTFRKSTPNRNVDDFDFNFDLEDFDLGFKSTSNNIDYSTLESKINTYPVDKTAFLQKTTFASSGVHHSVVNEEKVPFLLKPFVDLDSIYDTTNMEPTNASKDASSARTSKLIEKKKHLLLAWENISRKAKLYKIRYDVKKFSLALLFRPDFLILILSTLANNKTESLSYVLLLLSFLSYFHSIFIFKDFKYKSINKNWGGLFSMASLVSFFFLLRKTQKNKKLLQSQKKFLIRLSTICLFVSAFLIIHFYKLSKEEIDTFPEVVLHFIQSFYEKFIKYVETTKEYIFEQIVTTINNILRNISTLLVTSAVYIDPDSKALHTEKEFKELESKYNKLLHSKDLLHGSISHLIQLIAKYTTILSDMNDEERALIINEELEHENTRRQFFFPLKKLFFPEFNVSKLERELIQHSFNQINHSHTIRLLNQQCRIIFKDFNSINDIKEKSLSSPIMSENNDIEALQINLTNLIKISNQHLILDKQIVKSLNETTLQNVPDKLKLFLNRSQSIEKILQSTNFFELQSTTNRNRDKTQKTDKVVQEVYKMKFLHLRVEKVLEKSNFFTHLFSGFYQNIENAFMKKEANIHTKKNNDEKSNIDLRNKLEHVSKFLKASADSDISQEQNQKEILVVKTYYRDIKNYLSKTTTNIEKKEEKEEEEERTIE